MKKVKIKIEEVSKTKYSFYCPQCDRLNIKYTLLNPILMVECKFCGEVLEVIRE